MHKLEYSNRFCSLLIEEPYFCIWLVENIIGKNEDVKNYLVKYRSRLIHCHCRKHFLYCDLDRPIYLLYSWKVRRLKRAWDVLKRVTWQGIKHTPSAYQMITFLYIKAVFALSHRWISLFLGDSVVNIIDVSIILKHRAVWRLWTNAGTALTLVVMHLSAAIRGWPRGTPGHLHNDVYKSPYPKTRSFNKKLLTPLPGLGEGEKCALPSQKVQYFKRVPFAIINFLFVIIIHIRVN